MLLDWSRLGAAGPSGGSLHQELSHSQTVLDCYLALLHIRSGIATNGLRTDMSPAVSTQCSFFNAALMHCTQTKALILSSLAKFLRLSLTPEGSQSAEDVEDLALPGLPTWYLAGAFAAYHDYAAFVQRFSSSSWSTPAGAQQEGFRIASMTVVESTGIRSLSDLSSVSDELRSRPPATEMHSGSISFPAQLLAALLPIFVAAFLDTAPIAFAPGSAPFATAADVPLETVLSVTEAARDLWRCCVTDLQTGCKMPSGLTAGLEKLVGYMATYFPFGSDELGKRPMAQEAQLQRLNIAYCELVSLLHIQQKSSKRTECAAHHQGKDSGVKLANQLQTVQTFVEQVLGGTMGVLGASSLNAYSYVQLLPTIWSLLSSPSVAREAVFEIVVRHAVGLSAASGVKKIATGFLVCLIQVSAAFYTS